ncbi:rab-GTPase-TBC domain-containing protein [Radiomyces spectabilis]|uniref:rab-GTPase-TBC domain-containing protein n=1 Tax=Radiomyces spectabilis TaxID=64574 RepID=UPI00221F6AA7|nr:rab-GTPase-TBC domain-containing protein [Radiomyces spectabilis]KAI8366043.1 rab-GTPase-TBC domain-containing protein [Radiomyces spectabilis]
MPATDLLPDHRAYGSNEYLNNDTATYHSSVASRSHSSSSCTDDFDDAQSTASGLTADTAATEEDPHNFKVIEPNSSQTTTAPGKPIKRRSRACTITQKNCPSDTYDKEEKSEAKESVLHPSGEAPTGKSVTTCWQIDNDDDTTNELPPNVLVDDIHDQIHELQTSCHAVTDSDSDTDAEFTRRRHESHRSTMSSAQSFTSTASNYDLLLARLCQPEPVMTTENQVDEIRTSFERAYNEAVRTGGEDEIDWEFWSKVISDFNTVAKTQPKALSRQIQRGIPPSLRGMIWQLFAESKYPKLEDQYIQLLKQESVYEKAILRDLPRTFADHEYFQSQDGQDALFNVIKAYSLYDPQVGYSQGLTHIVGPLLLNMPEEEAFCVLVQMMNRYNLRRQFAPKNDLLSQRLYQYEGLLEDRLPHIKRHFEIYGIRSSMYAMQWFTTLFAYKFPLPFVFRIYDVIFAEGIDTLHRFAIALIERNQATILSLEFDELIQFLRHDLLKVYKTDPNLFVHDAFQIILAPKRLEKLAKEYTTEASRANTEMQAVDVLRKQNKALSEAVRQLECQLGQLRRQHDEVTDELISSKMETARVQDENDALRQQSNDFKKALDTLPTEMQIRMKEEMEILWTKNAALVERNSALEDQLAYMENMIIDMKIKYAESENERYTLRQRLVDLKKLIQ